MCDMQAIFHCITPICGVYMWNDRTKILLSEKGLKRLENASVAVIGIGGVGGYVAMMLARAGVGNLFLMDFDKVDETNINRQLVANVSTVGKFKTQVMRDMILQINPSCKVVTREERLSADNVDRIFAKHFDFVVDAIDSVADKVELICYCKEKNINIVSAMGAGNRCDIPNFCVMDIFKTSNDGLAKVVRKALRERGITNLPVAISQSPAIKFQQRQSAVGSISYYPAMCGCVLCAFVVNNLVFGGENGNN